MCASTNGISRRLNPKPSLWKVVFYVSLSFWLISSYNLYGFWLLRPECCSLLHGNHAHFEVKSLFREGDVFENPLFSPSHLFLNKLLSACGCSGCILYKHCWGNCLSLNNKFFNRREKRQQLKTVYSAGISLLPSQSGKVCLHVFTWEKKPRYCTLSWDVDEALLIWSQIF